MKTFLRSFLFIFLFYTTANSQWILKHTFPNVENFWQSYAVNENVYWGLSFYNSSLVGYFRTTDGGINWQQDTLPYLGLSAIHPVNADVAYMGVQDVSYIWRIIKTTDGGLNWVIQNSAYGTPQSFIDFIYFFDNNNGVAIGDPVGGYLEIFTTTNSGDNWIQIPNTNIPQSISGEFPVNISFAKLGNTIWVPVVKYNFNQFRVFKSTDRGLNWTASSQFLVSIPSGALIPSSIAFANEAEGILITSRFSISNSSTYRMLKTTDGGNTWATMNFPLSIDPAFICSIPGTPQGYFVSAPVNNKGSAYTLDGGNTWELLDTTLDLCFPQFLSASIGWACSWSNSEIYKWSGPALPVELISFTAEAQGKKVILRWTTATELNNNGFEVQRRVTESEFATVGFVKGEGTTTSQKEYSYIDKELADGKYFYRLKQADFNGSYEYSEVLEIDYRGFNSYLLEQNYPNPFNPTTTIGFGIQNKYNVKITILNAIGEEVAVVLNEEREPGFHQVEFNAVSLPSGVYFYRLQAGEFILSKKMILMR